jgi:hypothetical protein
VKSASNSDAKSPPIPVQNHHHYYSFNSEYGAGIGFGKIIDEHFSVELRGFYNGFDDETDHFPQAKG